MKIRKYFVSNSSSSSFICDVCGYVESGWDINLEEANMVQCENGHEFCESHLINLPENVDISYYCDDDSINNKECIDRENVPSKYCPLCQLDYISNYDYHWWLNHMLGLSRETVLQMIKERVKTYKEFSKLRRDIENSKGK